MVGLMIMAAGMSSRMKKESNESLEGNLLIQANALPKSMIRILGERPFLDYLLFNAAEAGLKEVIIVINATDNVTQPYYEDQKSKNLVFGLKINFAVQKIPADRQKPMGTADAILQALEQYPDWTKEMFIVCNGDNLYSTHILKLLAKAKENTMLAFDAQSYDEQRVRNCAIVKLKANGFLENLIEKPNDQEWAIIKKAKDRIGFSWNIFALNAADIIPFLVETPLNPSRNEKELPNTIRIFAKKNSIKVIWVDEMIPDLTSKEDLNLVRTHLKNHHLSSHF